MGQYGILVYITRTIIELLHGILLNLGLFSGPQGTVWDSIGYYYYSFIIQDLCRAYEPTSLIDVYLPRMPSPKVNGLHISQSVSRGPLWRYTRTCGGMNNGQDYAPTSIYPLVNQHNCGKSQFFFKTHYKQPCSIAMLDKEGNNQMNSSIRNINEHHNHLIKMDYKLIRRGFESSSSHVSPVFLGSCF